MNLSDDRKASASSLVHFHDLGAIELAVAATEEAGEADTKGSRVHEVERS